MTKIFGTFAVHVEADDARFVIRRRLPWVSWITFGLLLAATAVVSVVAPYLVFFVAMALPLST